MKLNPFIIFFLVLAVVFTSTSVSNVALGGNNTVSPAVEKLRQLGFDLSDSVLETIGEELHVDPYTLQLTDLLLGLGLGHYQ